MEYTVLFRIITVKHILILDIFCYSCKTKFYVLWIFNVSLLFRNLGTSYFFYQLSEYMKDCEEVMDHSLDSQNRSGVYVIKPDGFPEPFEVFCNNSFDSGGWTVRSKILSHIRQSIQLKKVIISAWQLFMLFLFVEQQKHFLQVFPALHLSVTAYTTNTNIYNDIWYHNNLHHNNLHLTVIKRE